MKRALVILAAGLAAIAFTTLLQRSSHPMIGQPLPALAPQFLGPAPDLRGKALLLEFWATWCPPCRVSIPHLNALHRQYKERGFEIIGLTAEDHETIRSFIRDVPPDYLLATDRDNRLIEHFNVRAIPYAVLADRSGTVIWEGNPLTLTGAEIERAIR